MRKPNSKIERRRLVRTQEILDAAQAIVVREGLESLTIPALARELDAAVGGMYRYFANKQALVVALQLRAIERLESALHTSLAQEPDPGLGAVAVCARTWRDFGDQEPALFRLIDQMLSAPDRLLDDAEAARVQQALDGVLGAVVTAIDAAQEQGALDPGNARLRTMVLWAALHGADHFRKRDGRVAPAHSSARVASQALRDLLRGWGASPEAIKFLE